MSNQKQFAVVSFCLLIFSHSLFSQIVLQGTVTDNGAEFFGNGAEPVVNALVTLTDQVDPNRSFSAYTDELGQYVIQIGETGIGEYHSQNPGAFNLMQNYPNPFNPSTVITFELPKSAEIRIEIYNILGQRIRTLHDGFRTGGVGQIIWDAVDDWGRGVPAGVYVYALSAAGVRINKKMLLIDGRHGGSHVALSQSQRVRVVNKRLSDQYLLQIRGNDILPYEQQSLEITSNMFLDATVIRSVTDIDGNVYRAVKIGDQWWMAENLKVTHYQNGDPISCVTDNTDWTNLATGAYCYYDENENYAETYGYLFNWYAVNDNRKLAPAGWHVPTDEEWKTLEIVLGMSQEDADDNGYRGQHEGGRLKEAGTEHWEIPNTGATNESGFTALPGGYRHSDGVYHSLRFLAFFWTSTEHQGIYAWNRNLFYTASGVYRDTYFHPYGFSIRCVRDEGTI